MKDDNNVAKSSDISNDEKEREVIADMSGLEPRFNPLGRRVKIVDTAPENKTASELSPEGLFAAVKGALAATFAVYFIYAAAFGIFIFLLTKLL